MRIDFYMGPEFLRTKQKTNPFFDPIIKVCEENGIEWRVLFPGKPKECGYPANKIGSFGIWQSGSVWFWRIVHLFWRVPIWRINHFYGRILGCMGVLKSDFAITIAGWATTELEGANPTARIVDVQHGVIYSRHGGYFDRQRRLYQRHQLLKTREFWLYGSGYADCFFKHPDNVKDLNGRVKIIGDVLMHKRQQRTPQDVLVVSGQFKTDCSRQCLLDQVSALRKFLLDVQLSFDGRYTVLVKHHPRFKGIPELDALYREFPFFSETRESWDELYVIMKVHVTFSSTVVFDAASNGILSLLLSPPNDDPVLENSFWRDDYHYPYYGSNLMEVLTLSEKPAIADEIQNWFKCFYAPFDKKRCLNLLMEKGVTK